jgi:hypothetical protein
MIARMRILLAFKSRRETIDIVQWWLESTGCGGFMGKREFILGAVIIAIAAPVAVRQIQRANRESVITSEHVGINESEIQQIYGSPEEECGWYRDLGPKARPNPPSGPIRTLVFRTDGGTLWIWLELRGSEWVCFESCWFKDGVAF